MGQIWKRLQPWSSESEDHKFADSVRKKPVFFCFASALISSLTNRQRFFCYQINEIVFRARDSRKNAVTTSHDTTKRLHRMTSVRKIPHTHAHTHTYPNPAPFSVLISVYIFSFSLLLSFCLVLFLLSSLCVILFLYLFLSLFHPLDLS